MEMATGPCERQQWDDGAEAYDPHARLERLLAGEDCTPVEGRTPQAGLGRGKGYPKLPHMLPLSLSHTEKQPP
jgi:hypothetical protein